MDGSISWLQILQVGGLAGVVSAIFGGGVKEYFEWRERKRKARHFALKLALTLENYYHACAERIYSIENYHGSNGNVGSNDVGLPVIAEYPVDQAGWIYLDQSVADEVLNLPAEIKAINSGVYFNADLDSNFPDGPDPEWTLEPLYQMTFKAIDLARRIRSSHGIADISRNKESEIRLKNRYNSFRNEQDEKRERERLSSPLI